MLVWEHCVEKLQRTPSVNTVTPALFSRFPGPDDLANADPEEVERIIQPTGFYKAKTRSLIGMAKRLVEAFGGEVPRKLEDLFKGCGSRRVYGRCH